MYNKTNINIQVSSIMFLQIFISFFKRIVYKHSKIFIVISLVLENRFRNCCSTGGCVLTIDQWYFLFQDPVSQYSDCHHFVSMAFLHLVLIITLIVFADHFWHLYGFLVWSQHYLPQFQAVITSSVTWYSRGLYSSSELSVLVSCLWKLVALISALLSATFRTL